MDLKSLSVDMDRSLMNLERPHMDLKGTHSYGPNKGLVWI